MNAIIDILIVCLIGLSVYFCASKGFFKTLVGAFSLALALTVALIFCDMLGSALESGSVGSAFKNALLRSADHLNIQDVAGERGDYYKALASIAGAEESYADFYSQCTAMENAESAAVVTLFGSTVVPPVTKYFCKCTGFLLLLVGVRLLLKAVEYILERAVALPELKQANRSLGGTAGVLLAYLRIGAFCTAAKLLMPLVGEFSEKMLPTSALFRFLDGISLGV